MTEQEILEIARQCELGTVEHSMWIPYQSYKERLIRFAEMVQVAEPMKLVQSRNVALEEAAQIVDDEALTATDNFEDEAVNCAVFSASAKIRERILTEAPSDDKDKRIAQLEAALSSCYCYTPEHIATVLGNAPTGLDFPSPTRSAPPMPKVPPSASNCSRKLWDAGKAAPRTCADCGLGPCRTNRT